MKSDAEHAQLERKRLVEEYVALLHRTESDLETLKEFSDPVWLNELSLANLRVLIQDEKDLLDASLAVYDLFTDKREPK